MKLEQDKYQLIHARDLTREATYGVELHKKIVESCSRHEDDWDGCKRCPLHKTASQKVYWRGTVPCDILFVGEAPGRDEDSLGYPFVGKAGKKIFDLLLLDSFDRLFDPFSYAVTNAVSCLPLDYTDHDPTSGKLPPLRQPTLAEGEKCRPRFLEMLDIADPRAIVLMGKVAKKLVKPALDHWGVPILEIYHPAYCLRQGGDSALSYKTMLVDLVEFVTNLEL